MIAPIPSSRSHFLPTPPTTCGVCRPFVRNVRVTFRKYPQSSLWLPCMPPSHLPTPEQACNTVVQGLYYASKHGQARQAHAAGRNKPQHRAAPRGHFTKGPKGRARPRWRLINTRKTKRQDLKTTTHTQHRGHRHTDTQTHRHRPSSSRRRDETRRRTMVQASFRLRGRKL